MRCSKCRWWRSIDSTCHVEPPVRLPRKFAEGASAVNRVRDESVTWGWPVVGWNDFCRRYRPQYLRLLLFIAVLVLGIAASLASSYSWRF